MERFFKIGYLRFSYFLNVYMRIPVCLLVLIVIPSITISQSIERSKISCYSTVFSTSTDGLNSSYYSVDNFRSSNHWVISGFQQPLTPLVVTSLEENAFFGNFYPNPTSGVLHVKTEFEKPIDLVVLDVFGKIVEKLKFQYSATLDLGGLSSGIYMIRLIDETNVLSDQKLIKL